MVAYVPSQDLRAVRYEEQRLQRLVTDGAEAERSGSAALEIARHRVYRVDTRCTPAAAVRTSMPPPST